MLLFLSLISISFSQGPCHGLGGSCQSNDDCCVNLCSPSSCFQGICIGSTCLANGNSCQADCQCCSGACVKNDVNWGTCGVPTTLDKQAVSHVNSNEHSPKPLDTPACCGAGGDGWVCNICCPEGTAAACYINTGCHCMTYNVDSSSNPLSIRETSVLSLACLGPNAQIYASGNMTITPYAKGGATMSCLDKTSCFGHCIRTTNSSSNHVFLIVLCSTGGFLLVATTFGAVLHIYKRKETIEHNHEAQDPLNNGNQSYQIN